MFKLMCSTFQGGCLLSNVSGILSFQNIEYLRPASGSHLCIRHQCIRDLSLNLSESGAECVFFKELPVFWLCSWEWCIWLKEYIWVSDGECPFVDGFNNPLGQMHLDNDSQSAPVLLEPQASQGQSFSTAYFTHLISDWLFQSCYAWMWDTVAYWLECSLVTHRLQV